VPSSEVQLVQLSSLTFPWPFTDNSKLQDSPDKCNPVVSATQTSFHQWRQTRLKLHTGEANRQRHFYRSVPRLPAATSDIMTHNWRHCICSATNIRLIKFTGMFKLSPWLINATNDTYNKRQNHLTEPKIFSICKCVSSFLMARKRAALCATETPPGHKTKFNRKQTTCIHKRHLSVLHLSGYTFLVTW